MGAKSSIYNNKNKNNGTKQIIMTISKAMIIELSSDNWWIDSVATRYTSRSKELFVELKEKEKKRGEHRVYMGNNTYSDVLDEGNCKLPINGI